MTTHALMTQTLPDTVSGLLSILNERELLLARRREHSKRYYQEHKKEINEKNKIYMRRWRRENAERLRPRILAEKKRYYERHREEVLARYRLYDIAHPEVKIAGIRRYKAKAKLEVITHYGDGKASCCVCGYSDLRALTIDHVNGGGCQHRKSIHGTNTYTWLRKNDYPDGYQTLCMNCQMIKRMEQHEHGDYVMRQEVVI